MGKVIVINDEGLATEYDDGILDPPDWVNLEKQLRRASLYVKTLEAAKTDLKVAVGMNLFMITLSNGKLGHASENSLKVAFENFGMSWTPEEIDELNGYLQTNNFIYKLKK